ncbi:hypothetical protein LWI28_008625 [Acer negundo]|uniref:Disease resistance RPP13-like protein 1 n=1 Tax=Acer negundo TaxID=4023 RepID=A0AAD5J4Z3_ACENE|nr:hypothetical protein LWI28_008625 [Acer negundo]
MAELFLSAVLPVLFQKLTSPQLLNFATEEGVRAKLKKWERTLKMIKALLIDAEDKQLTNDAVKMWLEDLQDLAYDAEDILDEYATEALRRKLKIQEHQAASTSRARKLIPACCIGFTPSALWSDFSMRSKIDDITNRLDDLCRQRTELGLVEIAGGRSNVSQHRLPTTSLPTETVVYGREEDKAKILEMVLTHEPGGANFGVVPIVGMGGIGKTTLAQQVYNDNRVEVFNPKAWVCVSDDFDVVRISKAILELITSSSCDLKELNAVQNRLKEALNGKKFLLVLDDVWSRSYDSWESLKAPFMAGAPGSKIIVTTRSTEVALTMRPRERYDLKLLSDGDCWEMFVTHAFNNRGTDARWNEDMIREKVVQKCKGLPLAAKTLGSLLYYKEIEDEWMSILNSKIWDIESNILPVLRLSYYHLPSHLKRCFAYCAILPKDYEFGERELVLLWIAEGLIQQSSDHEQLEDLGGKYFYDLLSRSLFQKSNSNKSKFVMHDLVNDLAEIVSRKLSFKLEGELEFNNQLKIYEKTRYASHMCQHYNGKRKFEVFNDAMHLRTHLSLSQINNQYENDCYISNSVVSDLLLRFKKLRVLSLQKYYIVELPNSIGGLRLLRYLNLSGSKIRSLPESINSMCNLQTLILRNCRKLLKWPYSMGNLINLRHLDILGACLVEEMPVGIRKWEHLRTLSNFIVGKDSKSSLKDLKHLKFLCGELHISRLENVIDFEVTREFILSDKKDLKVLLLEWGSRFDKSKDEEVEKKVLDMLRPHQNLEDLTIKCYGGSKFPSWVGDRSFSKMTILKLEDCRNCTSLPSLGLLDSLKSLSIKGMKGIKSIGSEFYGEHCFKPFQSLETLCFEDLEEWKSWDRVKENEGVESFPKLRELSIESCPKLSESLPNNLCLLDKLVISECAELVVSFSTFPMLCELNIDGCKKIVCNNPTGFKSLNSMSLSCISEFGNWLTQDFQRVEVLKVNSCEEIANLWQNEIFLNSLISLRELYITKCNTLTNFEGIQKSNAHLVELGISNCNSLTFVFRGKLPPSLKKLKIESCEKLECLLDDNEEDTCFSSSMIHKENDNASTCHLEDLRIIGCPSLRCLPSIHQLSASLTSLFIRDCSKLTTLSSTGQLPVALTHLRIDHCSELTSLLPKGQLPETLESLTVWFCDKLESIVEKFFNNMALCHISIGECQKLKSLPEGLETLSSLCFIYVSKCQDFSSFPKGGFPDSNLTVILSQCEKLEALPSGIHTLSSLLTVICPNMSILTEEGLPTKLAKLSIEGMGLKQYKALMEWGLHNLTSLTHLFISGGLDGESFQDEDLRITLPRNLTSFGIGKLPNLKYLLFKDFEDLHSLSRMEIFDCPDLTSLPILPSSLLQLSIWGCPLLKDACKRDKGKEWSKIADIPCVKIDYKFIYDPENP